MQEFSNRRAILIGIGIGVIIFVVATSILISRWVSESFVTVAPTPTATPTATPTPTPTPSPTPTDVPIATLTPIPFVSGKAEYIIDAQTGKAFYSYNIHARLPMASVTKVMTAIVALEKGDLYNVITVTQDDLNEAPPQSSSADLKAGDKIWLKDLLYGLLLPSGCDAAVVIAHATSGSLAQFVADMNAKAAELGLHDTHFTNPHGAISDANHYSSVADLVALGKYAMQNETFANIVNQQKYTLEATINHHTYPWSNTNELLGTYPNTDGIKTGSTTQAKYCLLFSATRNGHRIIGAELGAVSPYILYHDAKNLLDLAFSKL
jgi:D-alanyl-D-alanine carboxypeptidase (penicillin-binding protein 5/6)